MADPTFTAISQTKYLSDARRLVADWLKYYLVADYATAWAKVGAGVDVCFDHPGTPPTQTLTKPRLVIAHAGEEQFQTVIPSGGKNYWGSYCTLTLTLIATADDMTGGTLTCDNLGSALTQIACGHYNTLETAGVTMLEYSAGETGPVEDAAGIYENRSTLKIDFPILGKEMS